MARRRPWRWIPRRARRPSDLLPVRLELSGYGSHVTSGFGTWRGGGGQLWIRASRFFVPAFIVESQTRPQGTQQNYTLFSYLNWSKWFYTTQGISYAPQKGIATIYFPKWRYDIKGHWKLPPGGSFVLGVGYTNFDYVEPGRGQIFNLGAIYYYKGLVLEWNGYLNENQPGDLWTGAGSFAMQYGSEGKYWFGVIVGGGREQYRTIGVAPGEIRLTSYSTSMFYRRWLSRHAGFLIGFDYQDKLNHYRRAGGSGGLFFEF